MAVLAALAALDVLNGVTNGVAAGLPEQGVIRAAGGLINGDGRAPLLDGVVSWPGAARPRSAPRTPVPAGAG
jgi:hypothetical protein